MTTTRTVHGVNEHKVDDITLLMILCKSIILLVGTTGTMLIKPKSTNIIIVVVILLQKNSSSNNILSIPIKIRSFYAFYSMMRKTEILFLCYMHRNFPHFLLRSFEHSTTRQRPHPGFPAATQASVPPPLSWSTQAPTVAAGAASRRPRHSSRLKKIHPHLLSHSPISSS